MTEQPTADVPGPGPFTMVPGDPGAMVCEGDVCYLPAPVIE